MTAQPRPSAAPRFHPLKVVDVRKETDEATSLAFEVPAELADVYRFIQGQYLTLKAEINGEELRRPYSVCAGLDEGELRVAVKQLPGGRFSGYVNQQVAPGDVIDVMTPMGNFHVPLDPDAARHYVGIAGGSGITPFMSIIKTVLAREPESRFTLFYGNRGFDAIMFRDTLADLKDVYLDRLRVFHVLSEDIPELPLFGGLLDEDKIRDLAAKLIDTGSVDHFFICGPGPMMEAAKTVLKDLGIDDAKVKLEVFGTPAPHAGALRPSEPQVIDGRSSDVTIGLNGNRTKITVPYEGTPVLDAALERKLDLPFACKGGVCCTCKARLVEGEVRMDINYGLEPDEVDAGYILTCQSHPLTDKLVVDYDDR
jgi:ring-1,2-phenylacetyl-CoA epoxidase subunit PaaE